MDESSSEPTSSEPSFLCEASDKRLPVPKPMERLTHTQLKNTIEDLFSIYLSESEVTSLMGSLQTLFDSLPKEHHEEMNLYDKTTSLVHIEAYMEIAEAVSKYINDNAALQAKLFGSCYPGYEESCMKKFIRNFGLYSQRRPLDPSQVDFYYNSFVSDSEDKAQDLITSFLRSPGFLYRFEVGVDGSAHAAGPIRLSTYEVASRLSYFYLQSMPDAELFKAAEGLSLLARPGVHDQIKRLLKTAAARKRLTRVLANQWLHLDATPSFVSDSASLQSILAGLAVSATETERRTNMIQEVYDYFDYMIWEKKAGVEELLSSDLVFPRTPELAEIYQTPVWDGSYKNLVHAPNRSGLLTLAHTMFTGQAITRPIMRGVHLYRRFLCGELPAPADNNSPEGVVYEDHWTEREITQAMTEVEGTSCMSCHKPLINPLGFAYESFDSLGRYRSQIKVYYDDGDANEGTVLATKPVNAAVELDLPNEPIIQVKNGIELSRWIAKSGSAKACFSQVLWKLANERQIHSNENGCAIQSIYESSKTETASILNMLEMVGLQPEFRSRVIPKP